MKNFALPKIYLLLALLPVLTFVACGEVDDQTTPFDNTEFNGSYSLTCNGENYEYNGYGAILDHEDEPLILPDTTYIADWTSVGIAEATPEGASRGLTISFSGYSGTGEYEIVSPFISQDDPGVWLIGFVDTISDETGGCLISTSLDDLDPNSNSYVKVTTDNNNRFEAEFRVVLETGEVMEGSMQFEK